VTLCSPVLNLPSRRHGSPRPVWSFSGCEVAPTFPYVRLAEYVRKLPLALRHNFPVLIKAIRPGDLVLIRVPAANGMLAYVIARAFRKPVVIFLVGPPAAGALSSSCRPGRRTIIRLAALLEWASIVWMARRAPVFAYGSHLAERLRAARAMSVSVTFTSLVDALPATADGRNGRPPFKMLYAGRLAPEKGIDVLLAALKQVVADGQAAELDVVGDGPQAAELRLQAGRVAGAQIRFHGWLSEGSDLDQLFDDADLFVHPSRQEGIPKVLLKAMAHGLPVVTTNIGGIPDIVVDGEQGLLVPADDPVRLAEALERVLNDAGLRHRLGEAGRTYAAAHTTGEQARAVWRDIGTAFPYLVSASEDGNSQ